MLIGMPPTADNTELVASMSRYFPRIGGSVLIISRNGDLATQLIGKPDLVFKIDKLKDDDALKLLQNKLSADHFPKADKVALIDAHSTVFPLLSPRRLSTSL